MRLYLVRHPTPDVPAGRCYGSTDLPVLDADIEPVLAKLINQGLPGAMPVYASPLQRCARLARGLSPAPTFDARLAEMDFGAWELRRWDDIPLTEIDAWAADLVHHAPGGGETVLQVARRVAAFLEALRRQRTASAIVVCHAGTMRLLAALRDHESVEAAALQAAATPHRIDYGGVLTLQFQ